MNGLSIPQSATLAVDFVVKCVEDTLKDPQHRRYGVNYECALGDLLYMLKKAFV